MITEKSLHPDLTPREAEVRDWYARGFSSKYIAERMFLSPRTVEQHIRRVYDKTGIRSRDALIEDREEHDEAHPVPVPRRGSPQDRR